MPKTRAHIMLRFYANERAMYETTTCDFFDEDLVLNPRVEPGVCVFYLRFGRYYDLERDLRCGLGRTC